MIKNIIFAFVFVIFLSSNSFAQKSECDYKVEILLDDIEFEKEEFLWRMKAIKIEGKSTNVTGTAEITDSKGKIVKKYKPWTSEQISKQKTSAKYSPNLKEGEKYEIRAEIEVECNDINKENNIDVKEIRIKGEKKDENKKSKASLKSEKIDNTQNKEISKNVEIKQLKRLQTEKPDMETDNIIYLKKEDKKNQGMHSPSKNQQIIYESSNEKAKNLILIFLLAISILLNVILIWRR